MNTHVDVERTLGAFLAPERDELPDRVLEAAFAEIARTPQRRVLHAPWRSNPMQSMTRLAVAAVVALVVIAGAAYVLRPASSVGGPTSSPVHTSQPSAAESAAASLPRLDASFVSSSYGYQVAYPTGWKVTGGAGPWPLGTTLLLDDPHLDQIVTPSGPQRMRFSAASVALPAGTTMAGFRAFASPPSGGPCTSVAPIPPSIVIDGAAAVVDVNGCHAESPAFGIVYDVLVISGGRGYDFTLDGDLTPPDAMAWLDSIKLEPSTAPR